MSTMRCVRKCLNGTYTNKQLEVLAMCWHYSHLPKTKLPNIARMLSIETVIFVTNSCRNYANTMMAFEGENFITTKHLQRNYL